jgi:hypothetical protein
VPIDNRPKISNYQQRNFCYVIEDWCESNYRITNKYLYQKYAQLVQ